MRDLDLLVVGDCNPDLVMAGRRVRPEFGQGETWVEHAELVVGGTSSITACGGARLGLRTAMAGVVGDDMLREVHALRAPGTRRRHRSERRRSGVPDGRLGRARRAGRPGDADVPRHDRRAAGGDGPATTCSGRARHVHTGGWFLQGAAPVLSDILRRARAAGATTSLDPGADPDGTGTAASPSSIPQIDHLLPNAAEALALTGLADVAEAARTLAAAGAGAVHRQVRPRGRAGRRGRRARSGPGPGGRGRRHDRRRGQHERRLARRAC